MTDYGSGPYPSGFPAMDTTWARITPPASKTPSRKPRGTQKAGLVSTVTSPPSHTGNNLFLLFSARGNLEQKIVSLILTIFCLKTTLYYVQFVPFEMDARGYMVATSLEVSSLVER